MLYADPMESQAIWPFRLELNRSHGTLISNRRTEHAPPLQLFVNPNYYSSRWKHWSMFTIQHQDSGPSLQVDREKTSKLIKGSRAPPQWTSRRELVIYHILFASIACSTRQKKVKNMENILFSRHAMERVLAVDGRGCEFDWTTHRIKRIRFYICFNTESH